MRPALALHTAARRYCEERATHWGRLYGVLAAQQAHLVAGQYTPAALDLFPRYRQLETIQTELERLHPDHLPNLAEARARLIEIGRQARSQGLPGLGPIAEGAALQERQDFEAHLLLLDEPALARIEPLPFRLVLPAAEADRRLERVTAKFGSWYGGLPDRKGLPESLTFDTPSLPIPYEPTLRKWIGPGRIWELCELGPSFELDPALAGFAYGNGGEAYWADESLSWMVYASHEGTLTVAGPALVARLRRERPEWSTLGRT